MNEVRYSIKVLEGLNRPEGYVSECLAAATRRTETHLWLDEESVDVKALRERYARNGDTKAQKMRGAAPAPAPRMRGLGDVVARVTSAVGVKPCGRCKRNQARLNELVPFG